MKVTLMNVEAFGLVYGRIPYLYITSGDPIGFLSKIIVPFYMVSAKSSGVINS